MILITGIIIIFAGGKYKLLYQSIKELGEIILAIIFLIIMIIIFAIIQELFWWKYSTTFK